MFWLDQCQDIFVHFGFLESPGSEETPWLLTSDGVVPARQLTPLQGGPGHPSSLGWTEPGQRQPSGPLGSQGCLADGQAGPHECPKPPFQMYLSRNPPQILFFPGCWCPGLVVVSS